MHLMTAAILKTRILTACSNLVLMNSDLPEVLLLYQSYGSSLGLLGLQRDQSPKGSCSSLLSSAAAIRKTLGALPAWREGLSRLQVQLLLDREQHSTTAPQPPQPPGPSWGTHSSSGEGYPSFPKICFRALFLACCRWVLHQGGGAVFWVAWKMHWYQTHN